VTLAELVREIAGQLGNTWRSGVYQYENGRVPVIRSRDEMLSFGPSPEDPELLRVNYVSERWSIWTDMPRDLGIGESTRRIREQLIALAYAPTKRAQIVARQVDWHNTWCRAFTDYARRARLTVRFDVEEHHGVMVGLRAEFTGEPGAPTHAITVSPENSFPARIEYTTPVDRLQDLLYPAEPAPAPPKRRFALLRRTA
jgi:hypothetical protein